MANLLRNDLDMRPRPPYKRGERRSRNRVWWRALASKHRQPTRSNTRLEQRGSGAVRSPRAYMQRSVVKASYSRNTKFSPWAAHGRYLAREGAQLETGKGRGFDAAHDDIDLAKTLVAWQKAGDQHMFRWIVSPENGARLDLQTHARELMSEVQRDLGTKMEWIAIDHHDTDNPHIHILIRGRDEQGQTLRIDRDYIKSGIRARSSEVASRALGLMSENELLAARGRVVARDQFTEIDRFLVKRANDQRVVTLTRKPPRDAHSRERRSQDTARLGFLEKNGLAEKVGPLSWRLAPDLEATLRAHQLSNDVIKGRAAQLDRGHDQSAIAKSQRDRGTPGRVRIEQNNKERSR